MNACVNNCHCYWSKRWLMRSVDANSKLLFQNKKSIGFCLWPQSIYTWNLKLKFQSKRDLCPGNHVTYRWTNARTDKVDSVYHPSSLVGRGYKISIRMHNNHFLLPEYVYMCEYIHIYDFDNMLVWIYVYRRPILWKFSRAVSSMIVCHHTRKHIILFM